MRNEFSRQYASCKGVCPYVPLKDDYTAMGLAYTERGTELGQ